MAKTKRTTAIFAEVSQSERDRLQRVATAEGFRSFAEWVRQTLFGYADNFENKHNGENADD